MEGKIAEFVEKETPDERLNNIVSRMRHDSRGWDNTTVKQQLLYEFITLRLSKAGINNYAKMPPDTSVPNSALYYEIRCLEQRNYFSGSIEIELEKEPNSEPWRTNPSISVKLTELALNCSSIVMSALSIPQSLRTKDNVKAIADIFVDFARNIGYSAILYTASNNETNNFVQNYLAENWTVIGKPFVNQRTNNTITYFIKYLND